LKFQAQQLRRIAEMCIPAYSDVLCHICSLHPVAIKMIKEILGTKLDHVNTVCLSSVVLIGFDMLPINP
jgi:hypothetical protein